MKGIKLESMDYIIVFITSGSAEEAEKIADMLVNKRLAACVSIIPEVKSVFSWKGKVENEKEVLLVVKSKRAVFNELVKQVKAAHKYEVPEIIALPIVEGSREYLDWMDSEVN